MSAGCNKNTLPVTVDISSDGSYSGFDEIASDYTPDQAMADGCMVIVSDGDYSRKLYSGKEVFAGFLNACEQGDAFMRVAYFLNDGTFFTDLIFSDGIYYYIQNEYPDIISQFSKLRALEGRFGNPERDVMYYVLTDSDELTAEDIQWSYLSSSTDLITDIPFVWLGFTTCLTDSESDTSLSDADTATNVGFVREPEDFASYIDITPSSVKSTKIYKNPDTCDSVALIGDKYYSLGAGFGGYGLCDITEYKGYLIFTYSFGSGLHRSHIGVIELASGETVFTSEAFFNIDIMLDDGENGVFGVFVAEVNTENGFCALTLTPGEKLAELSVADSNIILNKMS
jgi:hypothetical protein